MGRNTQEETYFSTAVLKTYSINAVESTVSTTGILDSTDMELDLIIMTGMVHAILLLHVVRLKTQILITISVFRNFSSIALINELEPPKIGIVSW